MFYNLHYTLILLLDVTLVTLNISCSSPNLGLGNTFVKIFAIWYTVV